MSSHCPYCGNTVKKKDRFCIICGKPLLTELPKSDSNSTKNDANKSAEEKPEEEKKVEKEGKKERKTAKKEVEQKPEVKPLPEEVKTQIELHLELEDIKSKKKVLADKLTNFQTLMRGPRYETDFDFAEDITIQLKAVKTLIADIKQRENEVKQQITGKFIIEKLNDGIATKKNQLKNISREHKLRKMKKDVFLNLRERYKQELTNFETEKIDMVAGINNWISDLILEKNELINERKLNKGQFSAKEISEEEYNKKDGDFEIKINKLSGKIKTLETLMRKA